MSCAGERFWACEAYTSLTILPSPAMRRGWWRPQPLRAHPSNSHSGATASAPRLPGWPGLTQLPSHGAPGDSCPPPPASSWPPAKAAGGGGVQGAAQRRGEQGQLSSGCAAAVPTPRSSPAAPRPSSTLPLWNSQRLWGSGITRWLRCRLDMRAGRPLSWLQQHRRGETLRGRAPARPPGRGVGRTQPAGCGTPRAHLWVRPGAPGERAPPTPVPSPSGCKGLMLTASGPTRGLPSVCWAGGRESHSGRVSAS